ncbi:flagellar brake domain-containing protein [Aquibacillus koreensis]|uniref:Flagellar brake domain-containing protein n=1 Tax=Aquibacillus koreensis TaxID=279446 RepID=A0A9X3WK93_9BACI|nr:flagellar brake domain-containing protein [Aquibacillus koreensis]MCT2537403.1 flagellar brake domain-containing protein [Aquibacillus koreensis]MDC3418849.1 flagellar brake domain-containing protein [Aquibacillus koreensis]
MIKIGIPITLEYRVEDKIERYRCKVVELEGSTLYIDYPINEETGRTGIFSKGTTFNVNYVGTDNSVYRFETEVKGKKNANIPMLLLHYPEDNIVRIQRREYVRIMTAIDVSVHDTEGTIAPFTTITFDISGGGLSILLPDDQHTFKPNQIVAVWLVLPTESGPFSYVHSSAEVIRVNHREQGKKSLLSLKFKQIRDKDRQDIIRYCFENQLKERRRGLT